MGQALPLDRCFILALAGQRRSHREPWGAHALDTLRKPWRNLEAEGRQAPKVMILATLVRMTSGGPFWPFRGEGGRLVIRARSGTHNVVVGAEIAAIVGEHGLVRPAWPADSSASPATTPFHGRCSGSKHDISGACNRMWIAVPIRIGRTRSLCSDMGTQASGFWAKRFLAEAEYSSGNVKPGDHVVVDQPMVSVENTAKAVVRSPRLPFQAHP